MKYDLGLYVVTDLISLRDIVFDYTEHVNNLLQSIIRAYSLSQWENSTYEA